MKQMDTMLFQQSQSIDEIKNRLNCIETGFLSESGLSGLSGSGLDLEQIKPALIDDDHFVSSIVDNIMTNSNLSEIIEQIDAVQTENRELRDLLYAQQKTISEMNIMLLKIFSQSIVPSSSIAKDISEPQPHVEALAPEPELEPEQPDSEEEDAEPIQLDVTETPNSNMQTVEPW